MDDVRGQLIADHGPVPELLTDSYIKHRFGAVGKGD